MGTSAMQDDPMLRLQYYKETGQTGEAKTYEAYLRETGQWKEPSSPQSRKMHAADLARRMTSANEADAAQLPTYGTQVAGGLAALLRSIPGGEAVQAGARSLVRGQPYSTALQDIRGAEGDNPASGIASFAGAMPAAALMPGNAVQSGALYGTANGLLQADGGVGDRLKSAALQGGAGALLGAVLPSLASYAKSKITPSIGAQQVVRDAALKTADNAAYGAAAREGTNAVMTPGVQQAMANPITKEYVDMVRSAPQFKGHDEASIIREAYKLMSRDQGGHATFMENHGFDAARALKMDAIGSAKKELLAAVGGVGQTGPAMMESLPGAVAQHARLTGVSETGQAASDVASRLLQNAHIKGENLPFKSPEAFKASIPGMSKDEALAAMEMMLGRAKEFRAGGKVNPLKLFGLGSNVSKMSQLQPYLDLLAKQAGRAPIGATTRAAGQSAVTGLLGQ